MKKKAIIIGCSLAAVILIVIGCVFVFGKSDKNNNAGELSTPAVPSIMESGSDDVKTPDTPELSLDEDMPVNSDEISEPTNKPGNDQPEQTTQKPDGGEGDNPTNRKEPTENPTEASEKAAEKPSEKPSNELESTETATETPKKDPTEETTEEPTEAPTEEPTETPTETPTEEPTEQPTEEPTDGDNPNELPFVPF